MGEDTGKDEAYIQPELSGVESHNMEDLEKTTSPPSGNLVYDHDDEEPEIHLRTWIAMASMFMMNFVQVFALQGPPSVVRKLPFSVTTTRLTLNPALVHRCLSQQPSSANLGPQLPRAHASRHRPALFLRVRYVSSAQTAARG